MKKNIKIATVYTSRPVEKLQAATMDMVRWLKVSEALARRGYQVEMITNEKSNRVININANFRRVPMTQFNWQNYDIIKTLFHEGFETLKKLKGTNHPFIISKIPPVNFSDLTNFRFLSLLRLFYLQNQVDKSARYITVLNLNNKKIWQRIYGHRKHILIVPTGVDKVIPKPKRNPYFRIKQKIALFVGYFGGQYNRKTNLFWQQKFNNLAQLLKIKGIRLCLVGRGLIDKLDFENISYFGEVEHDKFWDYQYFANCGIVLATNKNQHNESSKIYYYLRTGLPVVSEAPVPNNNIILEANSGFISSFNNEPKMADLIEKAIYKKWNKKKAIDYILKNHTWDKRAETYDEIIQKEFSSSG